MKYASQMPPIALAGASMFLVLLWTAPLVANDDEQELHFHIFPYLQNVTTDGITLSWETREPSVGAVEFGEDEDRSMGVSETTPQRMHHIRLTGLKAGTTYHYQAKSNDITLPPATFQTLPKPGSDQWRVVVYGDNRSNPRVHKRIVHEIQKAKPLLVINTGDLVANGNHYDEWKKQYFDPLRDLSKTTPVFTCLGNHEKNAPLYYEYMDLPDENGEVYYALPFANAVFIGLNSNASDAAYGPDSPQTRWLVETLEKHRDKEWVVVYFHHPLFRSHPTRGITAQRWTWQPIFDQYEVDLVITGHDHHYMRSLPIGSYTGTEKAGVRHIISGGGGAGLYSFQPRTHVAYQEKTHHMVVLEANGDRLLGRAVNLDGKTIDAFSLKDKEPTPAESYISYEVFAIEQALRQAIAKASFLIPNKQGVETSFTLNIDNPFAQPLLLHMRWPEETRWAMTMNPEPVLVEPGHPIEIPIEGHCSRGDIYPVPTLEIQWTDLEGLPVFANNLSTLYPLKVRPEHKVSISRGRRAPRLDGKLQDRAWKKATSWDTLIDVQNDRQAPYDIQIRAMHHRGILYVSAKVQTELPEARKKPLERDALSMSKSENIRVHVGSGETAFTFLVNVDGIQLDAKGRDRKWNLPTFKSAAMRTKDGWNAELAIPLAKLALDPKSWRINFAYRNELDQTDSELVPSFGLARRESRIPAFTGEWSNPDLFAPMTLR
jgi:hypothetical protein